MRRSSQSGFTLIEVVCVAAVTVVFVGALASFVQVTLRNEDRSERYHSDLRELQRVATSLHRDLRGAQQVRFLDDRLEMLTAKGKVTYRHLAPELQRQLGEQPATTLARRLQRFELQQNGALYSYSITLQSRQAVGKPPPVLQGSVRPRGRHDR